MPMTARHQSMMYMLQTSSKPFTETTHKRRDQQHI
jgi:hypothetical protein